MPAPPQDNHHAALLEAALDLALSGQEGKDGKLDPATQAKLKKLLELAENPTLLAQVVQGKTQAQGRQ